MNVISLALLSAISAGVHSTGDALVKNVVSDLYQKLKNAIKSQCGNSSEVLTAIGELETNPSSEEIKIKVEKEVSNIKLEERNELISLSNDLLKSIKKNNQHNQKANGKFIAQANFGGNANISINISKNAK